MSDVRRVDDVRIEAIRPLISPAYFIQEIPRTDSTSQTVTEARETARRIVQGEDDRLMVVVGPCSIHDPAAAREYAAWLRRQAERFPSLFLVMRAYFEKPRTTVGWKGFINDPHLDGSHRINEGLREARLLLRDLAMMGLPAGTEFLDVTVPQYIADFVSWGAIGARTVESQPHRELASGLSMPVGFKNPTDGRIQAAVDAAVAARIPHWFASHTKDGVTAHFRSSGNSDCHIILRGGSKTGPNYDPESVSAASQMLEEAGLAPRLMVDCSHGNSCKEAGRQAEVVASIADQIRGGSRSIMGVMLESNLNAGRQDVHASNKAFGVSVTDPCLSIAQTEPLIEALARAVECGR